MSIIHSYQDLIVWQKAMDLVVLVYSLTRSFPKEEIYGLSSQMKRSAISIPSNIAEGRRRSTRNDFKRFIAIAYGSGAELETQIEIAKRLKFGAQSSFKEIDILLLEIMKMLNALLTKKLTS